MSAGANVKALQQMFGHAAAAMTLDVYADLFDQDLTPFRQPWNSHAPEKLCDFRAIFLPMRFPEDREIR